MSPKRMGRPPKPPTPGQMAPLSIRITAALKTKVQAAAEANGRSFGAEVESRLERSFLVDDVGTTSEAARIAYEDLRTTVAEVAELLRADAKRKAIEAHAAQLTLHPVKGKRPAATIPPAMPMKRTKTREG